MWKYCENIVPTSDKSQVKLGLPWLNAMHVVASPIHKCLKFVYDDEVKMVNHSLYHTSRAKEATIRNLRGVTERGGMNQLLIK